MTTSLFVIAAVLVYFAILAAVTYRASRGESDVAYATEGHNVSVLGTFSSLFVSTIDGAGLVLLVSLAGALGFGLYWFAAGVILAAAVHYLQAPRIKALVATDKYLTQNDLLTKRVGLWTSRLALIILTVLLAAHAASLLHITGQVFAVLFGGSLAVWVVLAAVAIGLYLFVGGYRTVIRTDIVQFLAIMVVLVAALFVSDLPSLTFERESFTMGGDWRTIIGTILFFALMFYPLPAIWQRLFTTKSTKTARRSLVLYGLTYLPVYFVIVAFGMTLVTLFPGADPSELLYQLASGSVAPFLGVIISVALLALTMSSVDTQAYLFLSTVASNWLDIDKEVEPARYRRVLQALIVGSFIVITILSLTITNVITFIVGALTLLAVLTPSLTAALYSKGAKTALDIGMFVATLIGTIVYVYMMWQGLFTDFLMNSVPGLVAIAAGLVAWLVARK